jgi:hypothetical protein
VAQKTVSDDLSKSTDSGIFTSGLTAADIASRIGWDLTLAALSNPSQTSWASPWAPLTGGFQRWNVFQN